MNATTIATTTWEASTRTTWYRSVVAHGFDAHYYSGKRVGELDAVVERNGDVLYLPLYLAGLFSPENAGFVG